MLIWSLHVERSSGPIAATVREAAAKEAALEKEREREAESARESQKKAADETADREAVVKIGRHAENHFVGVPCGILDQGVSWF